MGNSGDYWRESRQDKRFFKDHGRWPDQKFCASCDTAFYPRKKGQTRCQHCTQAWMHGYTLVKREASK